MTEMTQVASICLLREILSTGVFCISTRLSPLHREEGEVDGVKRVPEGLPTVVPILSSETDEHKMLSCPATPFPAGSASFSPDHSERNSLQESTHG